MLRRRMAAWTTARRRASWPALPAPARTPRATGTRSASERSRPRSLAVPNQIKSNHSRNPSSHYFHLFKDASHTHTQNSNQIKLTPKSNQFNQTRPTHRPLPHRGGPRRLRPRQRGGRGQGHRARARERGVPGRGGRRRRERRRARARRHGRAPEGAAPALAVEPRTRPARRELRRHRVQEHHAGPAPRRRHGLFW